METFSALLALCAGNSSVTGEFHSQRPATRSFDAFFDLRLNKRLSKQSRRWWYETPSSSLWCHWNVSQSLEAVRFVFWIVGSLRNLTGTWTADESVKLQSNAITKTTNFAIWYFTRSYNNTSYRILKRGPCVVSYKCIFRLWLVFCLLLRKI